MSSIDMPGRSDQNRNKKPSVPAEIVATRGEGDDDLLIHHKSDGDKWITSDMPVDLESVR